MRVPRPYASRVCWFLLTLIPNPPATRAPSAYNLYMKEHLKPYRDANPGVSNKEAMKAVRLTLLSVLLPVTLLDPVFTRATRRVPPPRRVSSPLSPWHKLTFQPRQVAAQWRDAPENPNRGQDPKAAAKAKRAPKAKKAAAAAAAESEPEPASDA